MAASLVNNGFGYTILDEYTAKACQSAKITELSNQIRFQYQLDVFKE